MQVKANIDAMLRRVHQEEMALLVGLSESERAASGTVEEMSAKDLLAHVTAAKQRQTHRLAAINRGETPASDDHDEAAIFAHYQHSSWQEIEKEAEHSFVLFAAQVDTITEADLIDPQRYSWMKGRPLSAQILVYGVWHPVGHLVEFYRRRGEEDRARGIYSSLLEILGQDRMLPAMSGDGLNLYNLACAYAVTGQGDKALNLLPQALRLDTELVEAARQDHDLDTLRADPAFQALLIA